MSSKLIVLGSVNADHVLMVDDFPRPGETVTGHGYQVLPGGKGANQAVAAARLGGDIGFIACVGDDDFGHHMIERFEEDGMNTSAVMAVEGLPTGIAMIQIAASGENSISISAEANGALTPEKLAPHIPMIKEGHTLLMQLESPIETIEQAAIVGRQAGLDVVLNPAPARGLPDSLLANLTMITPNETEAEMLTGVTVENEDDAQKAADILHDKGVPTVIITLGEKGAYVSTVDGGRLVRGFNVTPVDTTAAGDTFNGALVAGLQHNMSMDEAITFAHGAAAISVTRLGAQPSIPTLHEVSEFLKSKV